MRSSTQLTSGPQVELPPYSVVVPVDDDVRFLEDAVNTALAQSHPPKEIIIVNDAPGSRSDDAIASICARHQIVRSVCTEASFGAGPARNKGVDVASCDFIALLDADDTWDPSKMSDQLTQMSQQGALLCSTQYGTIRAGHVIERPRKAFSGWVGHFRLLADNPIGTSSVVVHRSLGLRFSELKRRQDWAAWIEMSKAGHACWVVDSVLMYHRIAHSSTSLSANKLACVKYQWQVLRRTAALNVVTSAIYIAMNAALAVLHDVTINLSAAAGPSSAVTRSEGRRDAEQRPSASRGLVHRLLNSGGR